MVERPFFVVKSFLPRLGYRGRIRVAEHSTTDGRNRGRWARINHGKVVVVDEPNGHVANTVKSTVTLSSLSATVANRGR